MQVDDSFSQEKQKSHKPHKILEFEGARGILSCWVLIYHLLVMNNFKDVSIFEGKHAVSVFFALSGFVIARVLSRDHQSYGSFIIRRFFRLFPTYIVCIFIAIIISPAALNTVDLWGDPLWKHVLLKITMLHGALPWKWVINAGGSLLNPAWSVSTEWQFYLVVPIIFYFIKKRTSISFLVFIFICIVLPRYAINRMESASLANHIPMFFIGIVSHFIFSWGESNRNVLKQAKAAPLVIAGIPWIFVPVSSNFGMLLWVGLFAIAFAKMLGISEWPYRFVSSILSSRIAVWLGSVSFSLYLCHEPIIIMSKKTLESSSFSPLEHLWAVSILSVPPSIFLAWILYQLVEIPGIKLGKHLTD